jgi:F-type H+-transporting ATPase subunit gamma
MTVYQTILESRATEHSARMVAMKNASDNARDLISSLTLDYNQARQSAVTSELLDVTTARMALVE